MLSAAKVETIYTMRVILNVIENLNEEKPKGSGKFKLIKRGIISKIAVDTLDFVPREIYDGKGKICKNKTLIVHVKLGEIVVKHKFDDVVKMGDIEDRVVIKGFRR